MSCFGEYLSWSASSIIHEICKSFGEDYQVHNISFVYQEHLIKYRTYRLIFELEQNGMSGNWLVLRKFIELSWKPYLEHLYLFYSLIFKQTENKYLYWTVNLCGLRKCKSSSVVWPGLIFVPYSWQQCSTWHCVKSVGIRSYSGPYFLAFGLKKIRENTDQNNSEYRHFLCSVDFHQIQKIICKWHILFLCHS